MILADTSVVVDYLRGPTPALHSIIATQQAAICGVTVAEILAGARLPTDTQWLLTALSAFRRVPTPETIWEAIGDNLAILRRNGITVPMPDAVIATIAMNLNVEVWTTDAHFPMMQRVFSQLRLF